MRSAFLVLSVALSGCVAAEPSDPIAGTDAELVSAIQLIEDPTGEAMCHWGCPVEPPVAQEAWPWQGVTVGQLMFDAPIPCPRWTATRVTSESITRVDGGGGGSAILGDLTSEGAVLTSEDTEQHPFSKGPDNGVGICWWDRDLTAHTERRVLRSINVPEARSLQGPLYSEEAQERAEAVDGFLVSSRYWKVISVLSGSTLRAVALIVPQGVTPEDDLCPYIVTIDEVEEASGLDLFPLAPDDSFEATRGDLAGAIGC